METEAEYRAVFSDLTPQTAAALAEEPVHAMVVMRCRAGSQWSAADLEDLGVLVAKVGVTAATVAEWWRDGQAPLLAAMGKLPDEVRVQDPWHLRLRVADQVQWEPWLWVRALRCSLHPSILTHIQEDTDPPVVTAVAALIACAESVPQLQLGAALLQFVLTSVRDEGRAALDAALGARGRVQVGQTNFPAHTAAVRARLEFYLDYIPALAGDLVADGISLHLANARHARALGVGLFPPTERPDGPATVLAARLSELANGASAAGLPKKVSWDQVEGWTARASEHPVTPGESLQDELWRRGFPCMGLRRVAAPVVLVASPDIWGTPDCRTDPRGAAQCAAAPLSNAFLSTLAPVAEALRSRPDPLGWYSRAGWDAGWKTSHFTMSYNYTRAVVWAALGRGGALLRALLDTAEPSEAGTFLWLVFEAPGTAGEMVAAALLEFLAVNWGGCAGAATALMGRSVRGGGQSGRLSRLQKHAPALRDALKMRCGLWVLLHAPQVVPGHGYVAHRQRIVAAAGEGTLLSDTSLTVPDLLAADASLVSECAFVLKGAMSTDWADALSARDFFRAAVCCSYGPVPALGFPVLGASDMDASLLDWAVTLPYLERVFKAAVPDATLLRAMGSKAGAPQPVSVVQAVYCADSEYGDAVSVWTIRQLLQVGAGAQFNAHSFDYASNEFDPWTTAENASVTLSRRADAAVPGWRKGDSPLAVSLWELSNRYDGERAVHLPMIVFA